MKLSFDVELLNKGSHVCLLFWKCPIGGVYLWCLCSNLFFKGFSAICRMRADISTHWIFFLKVVGILNLRWFWKFSKCVKYVGLFSYGASPDVTRWWCADADEGAADPLWRGWIIDEDASRWRRVARLPCLCHWQTTVVVVETLLVREITPSRVVFQSMLAERPPRVRWKSVGAAAPVGNAIHAASENSRLQWLRRGAAFFMVALCNRADHYILPFDFYLSSFFFPRLISAVGDWMSAILPHMVWP